MVKRKTAGELVVKAQSDPSKYNSLEVGHALSDKVLEQLRICAKNHYSIIDEPEFCIVLLIAEDCMIKGVKRHKYYAWPYLPKPRPNQKVFLYRKASDSFIRLWSLPDALTMSVAATMTNANNDWKLTKEWCDAFFAEWQYQGEHDGKPILVNKNPNAFFKYIRAQHKISLLSEGEYLNANREKLVKTRNDNINPVLPESFDFSKIKIEHIVDTKTAHAD